jgi:hypothetical protein
MTQDKLEDPLSVPHLSLICRCNLRAEDVGCLFRKVEEVNKDPPRDKPAVHLYPDVDENRMGATFAASYHPARHK